MRIQHNIPAMNSYRNYSNNTKQVSKNLEKLSSGYKINRAGDDAAGLAISQKMRIQITGLEQAQGNAKAGINLVQTAEGALTEVHDMLNRMYTLAEQSANGTYDNETDRAQLQKEVSALRTEIDRIADSSNYNGIKLLDGSMSAGGAVAVDAAGKITVESKAPTAGTSELTVGNILDANTYKGMSAGGKLEITMTDTNGKTYTASLTKNSNDELVDDTTGAIYVLPKTSTDTNSMLSSLVSSMTNGAYKGTFSGTGTGSISSTSTGASAGAINSFSAITRTAAGSATSAGAGIKAGTTPTAGKAEQITLSAASAVATTDTGSVAQGKIFTVNGQKFAYTTATSAQQLKTIQAAVGDDVTVLSGSAFSKVAGQLANATGLKASSGTAGTKINIDAASGRNLNMQIGDTAETFNRLQVGVSDMHSAAMGIGKIDISTQGGAAAAMKAIKTATNYVSDARGTLGALQNRLDHTINNLSVSQENIQDAESTIRDTDVASEMMAYTKNSILVQSAQAMLAQANQLPQGVLQLLG